MRDCAVHRSFYRCVSVHGTSYATVSQNVAYDVIGYCYYLEDGVEERNYFAASQRCTFTAWTSCAIESSPGTVPPRAS